MAIWDDLISPEDRKAYEKYRTITNIGFGKRPAIIVVDMTYSFVDDRFSTGCSKAGRPCIENIAKLIKQARLLNIPIVYTKKSERPTLPQRGLGKRGQLRIIKDAANLPDPWEIVQELSPRHEQDLVILKDRPSAFFGTNLVSYLNYYMVDTLIITGMSTSGCIRATAVDAFSYNYRVIIPLECVADRSETAHKLNLFDIHMKYGDVVGLDYTIKYLESL
ncbi:MAG: isochorismatase family protein [Bacillota bacterium]|jgi:maleamate amidohydrolase